MTTCAACATLQDETGGFQAFIPLPFLPGNTDFAYLPGPTREEKLRTIAVARLFLDSFPHVKGHWVMLGEEITAEALVLRPRRPLGHAHRGAHRPRHDGADAARPLAGAHGDPGGRAGGKVPVERGTLYGRSSATRSPPRRSRRARSVSEPRYTLAEASALIGPLGEAHRSS